MLYLCKLYYTEAYLVILLMFDVHEAEESRQHKLKRLQKTMFTKWPNYYDGSPKFIIFCS